MLQVCIPKLTMGTTIVIQPSSIPSLNSNYLGMESMGLCPGPSCDLTSVTYVGGEQTAMTLLHYPSITPNIALPGCDPDCDSYICDCDSLAVILVVATLGWASRGALAFQHSYLGLGLSLGLSLVPTLLGSAWL